MTFVDGNEMPFRPETLSVKVQKRDLDVYEADMSRIEC